MKTPHYVMINTRSPYLVEHKIDYREVQKLQQELRNY